MNRSGGSFGMSSLNGVPKAATFETPLAPQTPVEPQPLEVPRPPVKKPERKYAAMMGDDEDELDLTPDDAKTPVAVSVPAPAVPSVKFSPPVVSIPVFPKGGFGMSMPRRVYRTLPKSGFGVQSGSMGDHV